MTRTDVVLGLALATSVVANAAQWSGAGGGATAARPAAPAASGQPATPLKRGGLLPRPVSPAAEATGGAAAQAADCPAELARLREELRAAEAEVLRGSPLSEAFALLPLNTPLGDHVRQLVSRVLAATADRVVRGVECRGDICRLSLEKAFTSPDAPYEQAVEALRTAPDVRASVVGGFSWGPLEHGAATSSGKDVQKDVQIVPLYVRWQANEDQ
jgi:hypothetical protein